MINLTALDQSFRFHRRFDHAVIDLKDFTEGLITQ
jgi:hypothetical protein